MLEERATVCREQPHGEPELAAFEDEATWRAAHLEARAAGESGTLWRFAALEEEGEPFSTLISPENEPILEKVLLRLQSRGTLKRVLAALPKSITKLLARIARQRTESLWNLDEAARRLWETIGEVMAEGREGDLSSRASEGTHGLPGRESPRTVADLDGHSELVASSFGGVFYLLSLILELGMAEALWRACLPERAVLAHAAAALLGASDDPALVLFGGASPADPLSPIAVEQQEELARAFAEALLESLPRRGLAEISDAHVRVVGTPDGRLLTVSARETGYVLYARPARSAREARAALEAFLAIWPAARPVLCGDPALAELDRRGRIRVTREKHAAPFLPDEPGLEARALLAHVTGTLAHLFIARLGVDSLPSLPELVTRYLALPAEIELGNETIVIRLPMERIDLDVRRAGLDRDPGWVPWLGRHVSFEFLERPSVG